MKTLARCICTLPKKKTLFNGDIQLFVGKPHSISYRLKHFLKINGMFIPSQRIVTALLLVSSIPRIFKDEGSKPHLNPLLYVSQNVTLSKPVRNFEGNTLLELSYFGLINLYIHFSYVSFFTCVRCVKTNDLYCTYCNIHQLISAYFHSMNN